MKTLLGCTMAAALIACSVVLATEAPPRRKHPGTPVTTGTGGDQLTTGGNAATTGGEAQLAAKERDWRRGASGEDVPDQLASAGLPGHRGLRMRRRHRAGLRLC